MTADEPLAPSSDFLDAFRERAQASQGILRFDEFVELALYHPLLGYYRKKRPRVGYGAGTDFYTASTSGPLFGELIAAAAAQLLVGRAPHEFTFVEIGAEAGRCVLDGVKHNFAAVRTVSIGENFSLSGNCVVFSNELFDAQPFRRFIFSNNTWQESAVVLENDQLREITLPVETPPSALPPTAPEGYRFDISFDSRALSEAIATQSWSGLFLACDYGKTWRELVEVTPAGTARAYFRHQQNNDLLARPGEQDLTCHVCWDWLVDALAAHRFTSPQVQSHEAFFIHHAGAYIADITAAEAARFSTRKLALMQLLHPAHLGQKFQVLHAVRA